MSEYRTVGSITEEEFLNALTNEPQKQHAIFVKLGGDPNDLNYARLSFLTKRLRARGIDIQSSRTKGVWLPQAQPVAA